MKKMFTILMAIGLAGSAYAQHPHFGIKAGVNLSTLRTDADLYDYKTGFHAGIFSHIHLSKNWAFQPELMYSLQGGELKNANPESSVKLGYLNVPLLAQYMFNNGFRLETGPQFGLLLSAENKINNVELDIKDNMNTFDIGWSFGIGYITKSQLGIDARYNLGLSEVNETGATDIKNGVFQIGLFYQFKGR